MRERDRQTDRDRNRQKETETDRDRQLRQTDFHVSQTNGQTDKKTERKQRQGKQLSYLTALSVLNSDR